MAKRKIEHKQLILTTNSDKILNSIPKDPDPKTDRIDELARRVLKGDILLPRFQREFVWNRKQIINLLDSIARGYPIGSMLLWKSSSQDLDLRSQNSIADLDITLPRPDYPVNYLLDGQQRLSVICGALFWEPIFNPKSIWNIVFDLREQVFVHLDTLADPPLQQIRLNKLSDPSEYFTHVGKISSIPSDDENSHDKDVLVQRAKDLFNRFMGYKIATVTLEDLPVEDVAPIFERINSTGTPLTLVDLMRAATWRPDFDLIDAINDIRDEAESKDFHKVDQMVLLRNISVATGGEFYSESITKLRDYDAIRLQKAIQDIKEAFKRAVDYFSTQLDIQGYELLPYANQVAVLVEVLRRIPRPTHNQYKVISQWFWRTSHAGYFTGWGTGAMKTDLQLISDFADGKGKTITPYLNSPSSNIWKSRTFSLKNAHTKLLIILLSQNNPVDLLDGQKINIAKPLSWNNAKEFHHFFPRAYLRQREVSKASINSLSNFIMLSSSSNKIISSRAPSIYLREAEDRVGNKLKEWLESNLISPDAYEAAIKDDFESFIELRAKTLHDTITKKADWLVSDEFLNDRELDVQDLDINDSDTSF